MRTNPPRPRHTFRPCMTCRNPVIVTNSREYVNCEPCDTAIWARWGNR